ncbi:hypothetical protein BH23BAC1_BH23BAC1_25330 [soil metagenome]
MTTLLYRDRDCRGKRMQILSKFFWNLKQRIFKNVSPIRRYFGHTEKKLPFKNMNEKKFLYNGSPVKASVNLLKGSKNFKVNNPDKFITSMIGQGALGRIHSSKQSIYTVWLLDNITYNNIIIEVPQHLMGQYFEHYDHKIFPHLRN